MGLGVVESGCRCALPFQLEQVGFSDTIIDTIIDTVNDSDESSSSHFSSNPLSKSSQNFSSPSLSSLTAVPSLGCALVSECAHLTQ